ncbi:MAG: BREX-1 system adenine-specific DNA-methyltransferase PglX [Desulfuromonadales bacterium]|nr:BREX-1 system adenine-specific DNA-methyltransferase PglX [Desulfuromonadales bacterium]
METAKLKKFAQFARRSLLEQVSAKLKLVLAENSAARRERAEAIKKLEEAIKGHGKEQVIERVAYIWFNRFCALRFMDVNRYTRIGVVSPAEGQFQPEILAEAKMGHIDEETVHDKVRQQIFALLDGKAPSRDPQGEAYRLLVVAACNFWNKAMPFLFQRIDDYTELLMPDDLLSGNSILAYTREAMTPDVCGVASDQWPVASKDNTSHQSLAPSHSAAAGGVEVIGWLYQFYISEKKDEVFDGLKKNKKITPENIPAATQLFTPHWIVRYLVENSLGRLWLLNRPGSKLIEQMDYYIKPADGDQVAETDFLRIAKPEEIKICDPACGSGHMLTYAFDLLYTIYEEEGVDPAEIPEKILTHNLYGIEIDERAGELAAFALTMKARAKQRRFFNKGVKPNICVLENVHFDEGELKSYMDFVGRDLFTAPLQTTLRQFEEADNFGSLIRPDVTDVDGMLKILESKNVSGHLFISMTHQKVLQSLRQADYLSPKYHVVIANPPYMGNKGMNGRLAVYVQDNYELAKYDLFASFIDRSFELIQKRGFAALVTMQSWMFTHRYHAFRLNLYEKCSIEAMCHMGNMVMGIAFGTSATVFKTSHDTKKAGGYCYVEMDDIDEITNKPKKFKRIAKCSINDFLTIPGAPVVYWASTSVRSLFSNNACIEDYFETREGLATADNDRFVRYWSEVSGSAVGFNCKNLDEASESEKRWFPYVKGGAFRKWSGNNELIVDWENDGDRVRNNIDHNTGRIRSHNYNGDYAFRKGFTWSGLSSGGFSVRHVPGGFMFDAKGPMGFPKDECGLGFVEGFLNSKITAFLLEMLAPTMDFKLGHVLKLPLKKENSYSEIQKDAERLVHASKSDWDSYETSWDFTSLPLLNPDYRQQTLKATFQKLRAHWREMMLEMQRLEEENNRIFIDAYGLQDELKPEVPLNEITLTCNPYYRYGKEEPRIDTNKHELKESISVNSCSLVVQKEFPIDPDLEDRLLADTMRELVSYAVGCMFGRYALDKPGLILANQGETIEDYYKKLQEPRIDTNGHEGKDKDNISVDSCSLVVQPSFPADNDNVIPMLDGDWFTDDIAERFRKFLRVAFGDEHYEDNLRFVEQGLNIKGKRNYGIRDYFLGEFYTDHVKRYKKRPIYWLFSSPKGSFNALIYMHRYRPDTVSVVLNDYLREFRTKLTSHKNHLEAVSISASSSQSEKTKALKEIEKITKMIAEMEEYEREVLYPLATEQVEIDLDDGVKVNYPKLGYALKKIPGLDAKED